MKKVSNKKIYIIVIILGILIAANIFCTCRTVYESLTIQEGAEDEEGAKDEEEGNVGTHVLSVVKSFAKGDPHALSSAVGNIINSIKTSDS